MYMSHFPWWAHVTDHILLKQMKLLQSYTALLSANTTVIAWLLTEIKQAVYYHFVWGGGGGGGVETLRQRHARLPDLTMSYFH